MSLHFTWNGAPLTARAGDSVAAALTEAGVRTLGTSRTGRARGHYCGMGACQDCLVIVDGARSQRACMTTLRDGMAITAQDDTGAGVAPPERAPPSIKTLAVDLAIVGGGPAGLNAAMVARTGGLSVVVLDERGETGGQYFKPRSAGFRASHPPDDQHRRGAALRATAEASGASVRTGQTVWFARREAQHFDIRTLGASSRCEVRARAVILATGAMERAAMVPGWTRPGVLTIGAAQTLARRYGVRPGTRVIVAGHGPLGMQLAVELRRAGAEIAALAERSRPRFGPAFLRAALADPSLAWEGFGYRAALLRNRVPVLNGWEVAAILGEDTVTGARLRRLRDGAEREIAADAVCMGDGFAPQAELARLLGVPMELNGSGLARPRRAADGATEVPGLWIAGDAGGLGGADLAEAQGALAATGVLRHLGRVGERPARADARAARARRFQSALWDLYAAPPRALPDDDVALCRCEEVRAGSVRRAIADGAADLGAIKRATRLGMGRCQGRYCAAPALRLLAEAGHPQPPEALFAPQVPARPVPIAAIAAEKPEWGGHLESTPGARPTGAADTPLDVQAADLVVIGGGVTGISAALYAAREGARVVCLDRGLVNGEASGGNAGSLHLQLLSWDFGEKAVGGGSLQLSTLGLQRESIALWSELERELGADFEMRVTGGLMVAENTDQIGFLEAKAAAEARVGITTEVIGAGRVREIVPAISDRIVAAAWCAGEGKINPLAATIALAHAARAAGVRIEERTPVTGLQPNGKGYEIDTPRGRIAAKRVLIAAGGWSAHVADHLGVHLPIKGAPLQMLVTETAPPLVPCLIAHADRHLTMKQTDVGTVLIGGAWTAVTGPTGQPLVLPESLEGNAWVAAHTIPALGSLAVIRSWAAMNIDIDGAPLIGPVPGHPGVTVAATANGYTLGPLMGREAARLALSGRARQDLTAFSMDRFQ